MGTPYYTIRGRAVNLSVLGSHRLVHDTQRRVAPLEIFNHRRYLVRFILEFLKGFDLRQPPVDLVRSYQFFQSCLLSKRPQRIPTAAVHAPRRGVVVYCEFRAAIWVGAAMGVVGRAGGGTDSSATRTSSAGECRLASWARADPVTAAHSVPKTTGHRFGSSMNLTSPSRLSSTG